MKVLTKNIAKLDIAFEDIKRALTENTEREDKVRRIEQILEGLYIEAIKHG